MLTDQCISILIAIPCFNFSQSCSFVLFFSHTEQKLQNRDKRMICMLFTFQMLKSKYYTELLEECL